MNIEESTTRKLKLTDLDRLDPITIFLEDLGPRQGKITINCYDKSWSSYWGGMGDCTIAEFFVSCDDHYLCKNLSSINSTVTDADNLDLWLKGSIVKLRKELDIDREEARDLWDEVELCCENEESWLQSNDGHRLCERIIGDDWWCSIPETTNHEYEYLVRIVSAVREALQQTLQAKAA